MHKLKMVELHGIPCGGVGAHEGGGGKGPYREDYLDSAREMYSEGDNKTSKDAGTVMDGGAEEELEGAEMYVPVDEYGVPLLEPIIEASKEGMISSQNSQGGGDMLKPSPPGKRTSKKAGSNRATMHKASSQVAGSGLLPHCLNCTSGACFFRNGSASLCMTITPLRQLLCTSSLARDAKEPRRQYAFLQGPSWHGRGKLSLC